MRAPSKYPAVRRLDHRYVTQFLLHADTVKPFATRPVLLSYTSQSYDEFPHSLHRRSDLNLPDMSGFEVLRSLRISKVKTPTLILSGLAGYRGQGQGIRRRRGRSAEGHAPMVNWDAVSHDWDALRSTKLADSHRGVPLEPKN